MDTMLFPFELVEKNSKIVCYGFGKAGRQYWLQLEKSHYCEVVLWVDRSWQKLKNNLVDIQSVESLFRLDDGEYDYVVIAIENDSLAEEIKNTLICRGICDKKIIVAPGRWIDESKLEKIYGSVVEELDATYIKIRSFWSKTANSSQEYYYQLKNLFLNKADDGDLLYFVKNKISMMEPGLEKIIFLRLLYDIELFDGNCMKMLQNTLIDMRWTDDTPLYLTMDTSHMIHYGIATRCIYPDFYIDRRKLLKKICETYELHGKPKRKRFVNDVKKIAVLGFRLDYNRMDPATELVVQYTENLIRDGYQVKIFITNLVQEISGANSVLRKKYVLPTSRQIDADSKEKPYEIFFAEEETVKKQLQIIIDSVIAFAPDLVLDMSDDFCPQTYILHKMYPIICFPMRVGMSSSFFDYIFEIDEEDFLMKNNIFHAAKKEECLNIRLANMLDSNDNTIYTRQEFGISESSFLIVTVGGRLKYELDDELVEGMCDLLKNYSDIKWILVGDEVIRKNSTFEELLKKKIIINLDWENHLEALYRICDIYLEPRRNGGSHGMRMAMRAGLPVVISDYPSDNRCLFDNDYLCKNIKEMMTEIERLFINTGYREMRSKESKEIIQSLTKDSDSKKLMDAYYEVCRNRLFREEN